MWVRGEAEKDAEGNIIALWGAAQEALQPQGFQGQSLDGCEEIPQHPSCKG